MDFPGASPSRPVISSVSPESLGMNFRLGGGAVTPASSTWPVANLAVFIPFALRTPYLVKRLWWANGATANGNVDCGIYSAGGTLLTSTGSTAQSGTAVVQSVALGTPLLLSPGAYYMALASSSTTATFIQATNGSIQSEQMCGLAQQASALPLPATATFATIANVKFPFFGFARVAVI